MQKRQQRQHLSGTRCEQTLIATWGDFQRPIEHPTKVCLRFFVADARDEAEIEAFEAFETTWSQRGPSGAQPCTLTFGALGVWFFRWFLLAPALAHRIGGRSRARQAFLADCKVNLHAA